MTADEIDAARLLLTRLGLRPEDLLGENRAANRAMPTFADYIPRIQSACPAGTLRTYSPYWNRIADTWGERALTEPSPLEIRALIEQCKRDAVVRRNSRGGRSAAEHMIGALRALYHQAEVDGYLAETDNPATHVAKPRRLPSNRHALPDYLLAEITDVVTTTGNDPELDTLILRLHLETACRRGGALALRPCDLDPDQCLVQLREKGDTVRWQPVSPSLMRELLRHRDRGARRDDQLLRYATGKPITGRRYDYIWKRVGKHLPWAATQGVTAHWLRHTTLTWVERHCGYAVARAFAGHTDSAGNPSSTLTYVRASLYEIAEALTAMTGETHPLATETSAGGSNVTAA